MSAQLLPSVLCDECMKAVDVKHFAGSYSSQGEFVFTCHGSEAIPVNAMPTWKTHDERPIKLVWSNLDQYFMSPSTLASRQAQALDRATRAVVELKHYYEIRRAQGEPKEFFDRVIIDEAVDTLLLFRSDDPYGKAPTPDEIANKTLKPPVLEPDKIDEAPIGVISFNGIFTCNRCATSHSRGIVDHGKTARGTIYPRYLCAICAVAGPAGPRPR